MYLSNLGHYRLVVRELYNKEVTQISYQLKEDRSPQAVIYKVLGTISEEDIKTERNQGAISITKVHRMIIPISLEMLYLKDTPETEKIPPQVHVCYRRTKTKSQVTASVPSLYGVWSYFQLLQSRLSLSALGTPKNRKPQTQKPRPLFLQSPLV